MNPPPPTPHFDKLDSLIGLARGEYYQLHGKAIRKEIAAIRKHRYSPLYSPMALTPAAKPKAPHKRS